MEDIEFSDKAVYATFGGMRELIATADSCEVDVYDPDCGVCVFRLKKDDAEQFGKWLLEKAKEMQDDAKGNGKGD